jgi:hypothetical protein
MIFRNSFQEGSLAKHGFIDQHPERPEVRCASVQVGSGEHLRGQVRPRAAAQVALQVARLADVGNAEVGEVGKPLVVKNDILRLKESKNSAETNSVKLNHISTRIQLEKNQP